MNKLKSDIKLPILIVYHANCIDGFTSAWAMQRVLTALKAIEYTDITLYEGHYDKEVRLVQDIRSEKYGTVYVVDFSLSVAALSSLQSLETDICILDHHKTAMETYSDYIGIPVRGEITCGEVHEATVWLANEECGASLVWSVFRDAKVMPMLIEYVKDYDLWIKKYIETDAINAVLRITDKTLAAWDKLAVDLDNVDKTRDIVASGELLLRAHKLSVESLALLSSDIELDGKLGLVVNAAPQYASDLGHKLAISSGYYGATWFLGEDNLVHVSLRSGAHSEVDVSKIAVSYGGGGHRNAAGFTVGLHKWAYILEDKGGF